MEKSNQKLILYLSFILTGCYILLSIIFSVAGAPPLLKVLVFVILALPGFALGVLALIGKAWWQSILAASLAGLVLLVTVAAFLAGLMQSGLSSGGVESILADDTPMTEVQIQQMYNDAGRFKNKAIELTGEVFNIRSDSGDTVLQIYADPTNGERNTFIILKGGDARFREGDYIRVKGYVKGDLEYENAFGAVMSAPAIEAREGDVVKISYMEAVAPANKTILPGLSINQFEHVVMVDKVEFSGVETRVYVTVTNNSSYELHLYSYSARIVQGGRQFESDSNYEADYPEISSSILPGVTSSGILTFPVISPSDFQLVLDGSSGNYRQDLVPYQFEIKVQ